MKYRLIIPLIIGLSSCALAGKLKNAEVKNIQHNIIKGDVEFIASRASQGNGITIGEVLALEKKNYGDDISIVNIIEQEREIKLFFILKVGIEKIYLYDVVRYKKESGKLKTAQSNESPDNVINVVHRKMDTAVSKTREKVLSDNRANADLFLFQNPNTKELYYTHPLVKSGKIVTAIYTEAKSEIDKVFKIDGYFLPYVEELELLHKNINRFPFLPKGIYWSSEGDGGKIKCFDMQLGKPVLLEPTGKALVLPLYMLR